ncbi:DUF6445 family protein [uncultured Erythrobacter sp.]|uniref:DUF6445 family protein n=1 Tax=uncultured Erythrobacter sp. TaxID=263913 RepID=UPI0026144D67|nr:DUF6445 family protein [uncultured Erythrobacter sp.]
MEDWAISLECAEVGHFSQLNHSYIRINEFMNTPETATKFACLQKFATITPQYPGVRSPLPPKVALDWQEQLSPLLNSVFGKASNGWEVQAWFSLVTASPQELIPMQRFPHVDGTDPNQLAMMLYLHHTDHGGTGFFRHRSTGLEALTDETFPEYRRALQENVQQGGLPKAEYVSDGAPYFERIHKSEGSFNEAIFYRGNLLHSGIIDNDKPLSADPKEGRLTINAFFRPSP